MVTQAGAGINVVFGANGVGVGAAGQMSNATPFSATLNGSGQASIAVTNATTKKFLANIQGSTGAQSGVQRIDLENAGAIVLEADVQALASGKTVAGWYW